MEVADLLDGRAALTRAGGGESTLAMGEGVSPHSPLFAYGLVSSFPFPRGKKKKAGAGTSAPAPFPRVSAGRFSQPAFAGRQGREASARGSAWRLQLPLPPSGELVCVSGACQSGTSCCSVPSRGGFQSGFCSPSLALSSFSSALPRTRCSPPAQRCLAGKDPEQSGRERERERERHAHAQSRRGARPARGVYAAGRRGSPALAAGASPLLRPTPSLPRSSPSEPRRRVRRAMSRRWGRRGARGGLWC